MESRLEPLHQTLNLTRLVDRIVPRRYSQNLEAAISRNLTTTETLDKSIQRTFELMMRGGYFDPLESQPYAAIPAEAVGTNASHQLAKEAALQGMVLLANNKNGTAPSRTPVIRSRFA